MKRQQGFSLVMAIFVLVVVGLLGGYMVRMSGVQLSTANYALQGARAYQAARAGIDWAIASIVTYGGNCTQINAQTAMTFTGMSGFTVTLTCASQVFTEGNTSETFYSITALSQYGTFASSNYTARQLTVSLFH